MASLIISIVQIIISVLLIIFILLQQRGGGIGILGGLQTQFYGTRHGLEKILFWLTIILGALLIVSSVVSFILL